MSIFTDLAKAGRDPIQCLTNTWNLLGGDCHGVELAINCGNSQAPSNRFCRAKAYTLDEMLRLTAQQQLWQPDSSYIRLNPSNRSYPSVWHPTPKGDGTSRSDITEIRTLYLDLDPEQSSTPYTEDVTRRLLDCLQEIRGVIEPVTPGFADAWAVAFSGRGVAGILRLEALPNTVETAQLLQDLVRGINAKVPVADFGCKLDASVLAPQSLGSLPGIWKRKNGTSFPFARTSILCPDRIAPLPATNFRSLASSIGVSGSVDFPSGEVRVYNPNRATIRTHIDALIHPKEVLELLGYNVSDPACPGCQWLRTNGKIDAHAGGFGGLQWIGDTKLRCYHQSCHAHKGGTRPMATFDLAALHYFGDDLLSPDKYERVVAWFLAKTNVVDRIRQQAGAEDEEIL